MVAVLDESPGLVDAAGAEIDAEHGLDADLPAPVDEFVGAEGVRLGREPREVEPPGPVLLGADAVLPVVAGQEVAAGIAHDSRAELAGEFPRRPGGSRSRRRSGGPARRCRCRRSAPCARRRCRTPAVEIGDGEVGVDDQACGRHRVWSFGMVVNEEGERSRRLGGGRPAGKTPRAGTPRPREGGKDPRAPRREARRSAKPKRGTLRLADGARGSRGRDPRGVTWRWRAVR